MTKAWLVMTTSHLALLSMSIQTATTSHMTADMKPNLMGRDVHWITGYRHHPWHEHVEENDNENRASRTGCSHRLQADLEPGDDAEEDEQLENVVTREQVAGLSEELERITMTVRLRIRVYSVDDAVTDDVLLSQAANYSANQQRSTYQSWFVWSIFCIWHLW